MAYNGLLTIVTTSSLACNDQKHCRNLSSKPATPVDLAKRLARKSTRMPSNSRAAMKSKTFATKHQWHAGDMAATVVVLPAKNLTWQP